MKKMNILVFFLILSCQTKASKKTIALEKPDTEIQKTNAIANPIDPNNSATCVRVENCSTGLDIPAVCGSAILDAKLIPGAEGCKLKLVSFEFSQKNKKITLSPDERERLANVNEGEGIDTQIQTIDGVYLINIRALKKLPARINGEKISLQYSYSYVQFGKGIEISGIEVKTEESRFLSACENGMTVAPMQPLSVGEKNLIFLLKIMSQGLNCRDKYHTLLKTPDLFLYNPPGKEIKPLDFTIIAEFPNIKKMTVDGYFPLAFAKDQKFDELVVSHSNGLKTPNLFPHIWFSNQDWSVKNLSFDHIVFAESYRPISEAIPVPLEHLVLKNVVHLNFDGLAGPALNIQKLTISNTYMYDPELFNKINSKFIGRNLEREGVYDFFIPSQINPKKNSTLSCNAFKNIEECLFGQCVWSNSIGCLYSQALSVNCVEFMDANFCNRLNLCNWKDTVNRCDVIENSSCQDIKIKWKCLNAPRAATQRACAWDSSMLCH